jgi:hypothetical protein
MKEFLLKIVRNPGVRKAALALALAIAAAAGISFGTGCASFGTFKPEALSAADRARVAVECRVDVLEPYLGDQAERLVIDIAAGRVDPIQLLLNLDLGVRDIVDIAEKFNACSPAPEPQPAPAPDPKTRA